MKEEGETTEAMDQKWSSRLPNGSRSSACFPSTATTFDREQSQFTGSYSQHGGPA